MMVYPEMDADPVGAVSGGRAGLRSSVRIRSRVPGTRNKGQTMIRKKAKIALTTVYDARKVRLEVGFPFMSEPEIREAMGSHHHRRRAE
jgi:hypothetical protein